MLFDCMKYIKLILIQVVRMSLLSKRFCCGSQRFYVSSMVEPNTKSKLCSDFGPFALDVRSTLGPCTVQKQWQSSPFAAG